MAKIIEAKAIISAEDRLSGVLDKAGAKLKNFGKGIKASVDVDRLNKSLETTQRQLQAIDRIKAAQDRVSSSRMGLAGAQAQADRAASALATARKAGDAKAIAELTAQSKVAQRTVQQTSNALERQAGALRDAKRAFSEFGVPVTNLVGHERALRGAVEQTTAALRKQAAEQKHLQDAAARQAKVQQAAADRNREIGKHGVVHATAAGAAGYVGVSAVGHVIGSAVKDGARYQHEVVALQNAGRTPAEMKEIEHASSEATKSVPTATFEENLKVVNETTGAFGSLHHAIENLPFMQKSAFALKMSAGDKVHEDAGELGNKLARFFEMRGTAGNTEVFQKEAAEMVRAMVFTRGNFNPGEMVNFAQQAKASLPNYSERFLTKIAPSLVTEFGGDRAGTAANAFRGTLMGKANDAKQAQEWMRLGLLDPSQTINKAGHAVSWKAGAVKNTDVALSDPLKWFEETMIPAMKAKGIDTDNKLDLTKALGTLFRNSNSNLFAEALTQNASRGRLHKDEANINQAGTLDEIYQRNLKSDPTASVKALSAALENLATAASSPAMESAAGVIKSVAEGLQSLALAAKEHPNLAVTGGVAAAGAGLAGAGYMSYQLLNGFGLGTSAVALDGSAVALTEAAAVLGAKGAIPTALATAATAGAGAVVGGAATGATIALGAVVGASSDALTPGTGPGVLGTLTGEISSLNQTMQTLERERGGEAASKRLGYGGTHQTMTMPGGSDPKAGFSTTYEATQGAVKDFFLGKQKVMQSLPAFGAGNKQIPQEPLVPQPPRRPGEFGGSSPITAEVKTMPPLSGEVTGTGTVTATVTVVPSPLLTATIAGLERAVLELKGKVSSIGANGPGSTGKSSPDAGKGGKD